MILDNKEDVYILEHFGSASAPLSYLQCNEVIRFKKNDFINLK